MTDNLDEIPANVIFLMRAYHESIKGFCFHWMFKDDPRYGFMTPVPSYSMTQKEVKPFLEHVPVWNNLSPIKAYAGKS